MAFIAGCHVAFGQSTFSPYTINGIGDLHSSELASNFAMGGLGVAAPSFYHINNQNPALLIHNTLSVFQMGIAGETRQISSSLRSQRGNTAGLRYLAFAFPVIRTKWTTSFGVTPFSTVNYSILSAGDVQGSDVPVTYNVGGEGAISKAYFSNGFSLGKGFSLGVTAQYMFGFIDSEILTILADNSLSIALPTAIFENTSYKGFRFSGGLAYRKEYKEDSYFNFGLTAESATDLEGTRLVRLERRSVTDAPIPGDTIVSNQKDNFALPTELAIGFSWQKLNKFTIGIDVHRKNWNKSPGFETDLDQYRSTWTLGVGIEFIPKFNDVNSYIKRIKYRFGVNYEQVPYITQNSTINDFGINFGWSLPVNVVSSVDMGFKLGQRGTTDNSLVRERYFKFVLGATINDRWFVRRRYD